MADGRIVGRDLRGQLLNGGALGIDLLPGREFAELGVALQIQIGVGEIGLVLFLLGLGLIERRLVRPGIDLDEQVALIDHLAFLEGDLVDLAVDAGTHQDGVEALNRSKPGQIDRKIGFLDRRDGDANGIACRFLRIARRGCLVLRSERAASRNSPAATTARSVKPNESSATLFMSACRFKKILE